MPTTAVAITRPSRRVGLGLDVDLPQVELERLDVGRDLRGHRVDLLGRHATRVNRYGIGFAGLVREQDLDAVTEDHSGLGCPDPLRGKVEAEYGLGAAVEAGFWRDDPHRPGRSEMGAEARESESPSVAVADREHDS
jgi:hypothetical protein